VLKTWATRPKTPRIRLKTRWTRQIDTVALQGAPGIPDSVPDAPRLSH
jgi:hypothetical protein